MQAIIGGNATFSYTADLPKVESIPGTFSLSISSGYTGAKSSEPRQVFQTTLDRDGLLALRALIDSEVARCQYAR
jgi:hypothetical protein